MALLQTLNPSSSFSYGFTYDVFLSFRGCDTRYGFTGNLYKALCDSGIRTFIDDRELHGGDEIKPSLFKAIEESRIAILVFSVNYASSSFCLDELVHITHFFSANNRLVLPIFYGVEPTVLRHQIGSYGDAIAKHGERFQNNQENMERLHKWKMALNQASNLSGYHWTRDEYEYDFIGKIVEVISSKINRAPLHVVDYPVGMEPRVLQVKLLLDIGFDDRVLVVGIIGTGGIGKTTLARTIYNLFASQFEALCFLHNVRQNSTKHGLENLQEKILSKTIGLNINFGDVNEGIPIIQQRLHRKKVLLILDDVDELKQLHVLAGGSDWFGLGSRVIITTRDKHLLASHGIERMYEVDVLNGEEALELLKWKAFKSSTIDSSYADILNRAVSYASGLPLALDVIGSNLFGKQIEEWKSALDQYKKIPNKEIQNILKVSFNALEEKEQSVFLDIACCFDGYKLADVEDILCAHYGQCVKYHIGVLVEKSLIKIRHLGWDHDRVKLHDLIEDMGKEIVNQESPKEPGKRSRLWFHKDIVQILEENKGSSEIEIIYLDCPSNEEVLVWNREAFKKMKNLKTLIVKSGNVVEGPTHFPSSLRVLDWCRYPSSCIPSNFHPKQLVICKLPDSCFTSSALDLFVNTTSGKFVQLKILNFDYSKHITYIPDVSGVPNLEELSFEWCVNLITIDSSVGFLSKLKFLNAGRCKILRSFPPLRLNCLQNLELSSCLLLENFPEILGEIKNVRSISLSSTSIEELPNSFHNFSGLETLKISRDGMTTMLPSSIFMMPNLSEIEVEDCDLLIKQNGIVSSTVSSNVKNLCFRECNLSDKFLPIIFNRIANVVFLNLSANNFTIFPEYFEECFFLRILILDDCKCLREIRGIPPNLLHLSASNCESLTSKGRSMLLNQELHEDGGTDFCLSGTARTPNWFEHRSRGKSISFWFRNKFPSVVVFFATKLMNKECYRVASVSLAANLIINGYKGTLLGHCETNSFIYTSFDHTYLFDLKLQDWVRYMKHYETRYSRQDEYKKFKSKLDEALLKNEWIHVEVRFEGRREMIDKYGDCVLRVISTFTVESGIHVFKASTNMEDIRFINPYRKRKLDEYLNGSVTQNNVLLKKHRIVDVKAFETQTFLQKLRMTPLLLIPIRDNFLGRLDFCFLLFVFSFVILFWRVPYLLFFL